MSVIVVDHIFDEFKPGVMLENSRTGELMKIEHVDRERNELHVRRQTKLQAMMHRISRGPRRLLHRARTATRAALRHLHHPTATSERDR